VIYSHASFGSISHRNIERIGLRVLHTQDLDARGLISPASDPDPIVTTTRYRSG
jgi:hypothetical protein